MLTLGNYLTPTLLGGKNSLWFTEQIYAQFITRFNWEQGAAFGFLLLALSTAIVWLGLKLTGQRFATSCGDHDPVVAPQRARTLRRGGYVAAFFAFLFLPLAVVALFAFNDANYPAPPWRGFTLDWFLGAPSRGRVGLFADYALLSSIATSIVVAGWVTVLAVAVGTVNAFLLERARFRGKAALSLAMLAPLVIPGVILGISILAFASRLARFADDVLGVELEFLRPGLPLVVAGQFSFIVTIATLTIAARLKRFDVALEEAALTWGRPGPLCSGRLRFRTCGPRFSARPRSRSSCRSRTSIRR